MNDEFKRTLKRSHSLL